MQSKHCKLWNYTLAEKEREQQILTFIKPYNPVAPSTIARCLKSVLSKAGIHKCIQGSEVLPFLRSTARAGITTSDQWRSHMGDCRGLCPGQDLEQIFKLSPFFIQKSYIYFKKLTLGEFLFRYTTGNNYKSTTN